jgi:hypothetical protein
LARTYRKHVTWSLSTVVWRHRLCGSVFTKALSSNGLHNPVVLFLRACIAACSSSRCLVMLWHVTIYLRFVMLGGIIIAYRNNWERAETQATQHQEEGGSHDWIQRVFQNVNVSSTKERIYWHRSILTDSYG